MLTRIKIEGLRGITEADIDGLAPVTILVGANGSGKSTVLEAIGVACARDHAESAFRALSRREWLGLEGVRYWFTGPKESAAVTVTVDGDRVVETSIGLRPINAELAALAQHTAQRTDELAGFTIRKNMLLQALVDEDGDVVASFDGVKLCEFSLETAFVERPVGAQRRLGRTLFSSAFREALAKIKLSPYYDDLIEYLQVIRPNLASIESLAVGDRDEPHIFERDPRVGYPLAYAGDGFRRTLLLAAAFARTKGGVVAIDEPEAFAHPRLFSSVARLIRRAVDEGTQVFLATHSLEFIEATLKVYEDSPEAVAVVGLDNDRGRLDPVVISGPNAYRRVVELGDDLRL